MASLVTLQQARAHLKEPPVALDGDLYLKCEQASAIILEYLKGRAHEASSTATVSTSSVASPTVITTVSPHTFLAAETVFVSGHIGSVPSLNGLWTVSTPTASSFTIPVAVTTAGTGGTVSLTWTAATVPAPVQASILLMAAHLFGFRGDDPTSMDAVATWLAIERLLCRSRDPALV